MAPIAAAAVGRDGDALDYLEEILAQYPADICALRVAHYLHFYRGKGEAMAASTERVSSAYSEDTLHYGYYLGMHAFGLEESGQLDQAERVGRQAAEINPGIFLFTIAGVLFGVGLLTKALISEVQTR